MSSINAMEELQEKGIPLGLDNQLYFYAVLSGYHWNTHFPSMKKLKKSYCAKETEEYKNVKHTKHLRYSLHNDTYQLPKFQFLHSIGI